MSRLAAKDKMHDIIAHANPSASPNPKHSAKVVRSPVRYYMMDTRT